MTIEIQNIKFEGEIYDKIYEEFNIQAEQKTNIPDYWGDQICLAAIDNTTKETLGIIFFSLCGGQLWISQFYVMEQSRGKGIGKTLLNKVIEYAKEQDCDFIYLETMSFHNIEFYKKNGFKEDFKRGGFSGNASWLYMSKNLK